MTESERRQFHIENTASTMKAAIITGPRQFCIEERPLPVPGRREVRVALQGCGVCASNLVPWSGPDWMEFPTPPGGLGHEGWGYVDHVGDGADPALLGRRVATLSQTSYAEYDIARTDQIVVLPEVLDGMPFPGEPLGCAMNIFRRSRIRAGDRVAIVGIGFLGGLLTQLAAAAGAQVIAISRRPSSLVLARLFGADSVVEMDDHHAVIERVRELTEGGFCDVVIETAGKQWPLDLAAELTAERGRLVVAGYHQDGPRQINMQLWNWRGLDVINAHERDPAIYVRGVCDAVSAVAEGRLDPTPLYTHTYPLEHLGDALEDATDKPEDFVKALIVY
ncbi:MAG: zinc-binding dehydrogenase [Martelella sp.]|uniref:MDR/zinc-dependent alcohol dehydrogenase-like family protein n=1 Tax=Martelella sp. TaxID=1969699 RepID=UPI00324259D9